MRILFADSIRIWGGAQRFILETVEGLIARGHDVTIQTFPDSKLSERARKHGVPVSEVRTRTDSAPWTVLPLATRMRRRPYDVVVTTFDKDLRTTGLAARLAGRGTVVIHSRECDDPVKNKKRHAWYYNHIADHIFVNSQATLDTTLESAPWLDEGRTSIIYKGIPLDEYEDLDPKAWRSTIDPGGDRVIVGYAGQLVRRKRIDVLMRALASDGVSDLSWHLAIAGKGPEEDSLHAEADRLGISDRVTFNGFVKDLRHWMAAIDFFVLPSLIEGFGYVLAEAGAAGKPSVAYRASSVPEVVIEGKTAFLAESGNDEELALHLKRMIADRDLREKMGAAARDDVFARHGLDAMVDRIEKRMYELIGR